MSACTFAATAAKIAAPSAQIGQRQQFAAGDSARRSRPAYDLVFPRDAAQRHHVIDGDPRSVKHSMIARAPKAVAAIKPRTAAERR